MRYLLGGHYGMRNVGDDVLLYVTLAEVCLHPGGGFVIDQRIGAQHHPFQCFRRGNFRHRRVGAHSDANADASDGGMAFSEHLSGFREVFDHRGAGRSGRRLRDPAVVRTLLAHGGRARSPEGPGPAPPARAAIG